MLSDNQISLFKRNTRFQPIPIEIPKPTIDAKKLTTYLDPVHKTLSEY